MVQTFCLLKTLLLCSSWLPCMCVKYISVQRGLGVHRVIWFMDWSARAPYMVCETRRHWSTWDSPNYKSLCPVTACKRMVTSTVKSLPACSYDRKVLNEWFLLKSSKESLISKPKSYSFYSQSVKIPVSLPQNQS